MTSSPRFLPNVGVIGEHLETVWTFVNAAAMESLSRCLEIIERNTCHLPLGSMLGLSLASAVFSAAGITNIFIFGYVDNKVQPLSAHTERI